LLSGFDRVLVSDISDTYFLVCRVLFPQQVFLLTMHSVVCLNTVHIDTSEHYQLLHATLLEIENDNGCLIQYTTHLTKCFNLKAYYGMSLLYSVVSGCCFEIVNNGYGLFLKSLISR